jgi:hypothetical protein
MKGGSVVLGDFGLARNASNGYSCGRFAFVGIGQVGYKSLSKEDAALINRIRFFQVFNNTKPQQRRLRDAFIQLWSNSQKWECLSNEELAAKVEPLLENASIYPSEKSQ